MTCETSARIAAAGNHFIVIPLEHVRIITGMRRMAGKAGYDIRSGCKTVSLIESGTVVLPTGASTLYVV